MDRYVTRQFKHVPEFGQTHAAGADVQDLLSPVAYVLNIQPARRKDGDVGPVVSHGYLESGRSICHMLAADPGLAFDNIYTSWAEEHEPRSMLGDEAPLCDLLACYLLFGEERITWCQ